MNLIDRIREFAAETQSIYLETMLAIQAAQKAKIKARKDLLANGFRAAYSLDAWRRVDVEKIHADFRALLTDRINHYLKNVAAGIEIGIDELPSFVAPEYRKHASLDLDDFALIEVDAALKANFVADVNEIAEKFSPETIAERARSEAIDAVKSKLGIGTRWTTIREDKGGMLFEISNRNDPAPDSVICYDTANRIYAIATAVDALIRTEVDAGDVGSLNLREVGLTLDRYRSRREQGRPRLNPSKDLGIVVFKSKIEVTVSLPLFALISAATAPDDAAKAA